jgi:hypothetical protein
MFPISVPHLDLVVTPSYFGAARFARHHMNHFPFLKLVLVFFLITAPGFLRAEGPTTLPGGAAEVRARREAFFRKVIVDDYEKLGPHDPKWDEPARKLMQLALQRWIHGSAPDQNRNHEMIDLGLSITKAGCKDPNLGYQLAHVFLHSTETWPFYRDASNDLSNSKYSLFLQVAAVTDVLSFYSGDLQNHNQEIVETVARVIKGLYQRIPNMLAEPGCPPYDAALMLIDLTEITKLVDGDRKIGFDAMQAMMKQKLPDSPIADLFEGMFYRHYAWDARGNGFAGTVTDGGWQLFGERLQAAQKAINRALDKDPHVAGGSVEMLAVLQGLPEDRAEMEKWFRRAVADDPDAYEAYVRKMYYLTPKWHGSDEDQFAFGRECLATQRWESRIPFLLLQSHDNIYEGRWRQLRQQATTQQEASTARNRARTEFYATHPEVWPDIQKLYDGYLAWNPKAVYDMADYAQFALMCGHLDVAKKQVDRMAAVPGPDPLVKQIRDLVQLVADRANSTAKPEP